MQIKINKPLTGSIGVFCIFLLVLQTSQLITDDTSQLINPNETFPGNIRFYVDHSAIYISSNGDFDAVKSGGNGSAVDPYIIEDLNITVSDQNAIVITGTSSHFVIRDCWIKANGSGNRGLDLRNVGNGTATITNNVISGCDSRGIAVDEAPFACIENNVVSNNDFNGIFVDDSPNASLINNTVYGNYYGIQVEDSDDLRVINNTCYSNEYYGVDISRVNSPLVFNNTCYGNNASGMKFWETPNAVVLNNTVKTSTHSSAIHFYDAANSTISNNTCLVDDSFDWAYGIDVSNCPDSNVTDNYASIYGGDCEYTLFANNTCTGYGLDMYNSPHSKYIDNIFLGSGLSIYEFSETNMYTLEVSENIVNGLPLAYLVNMTGGIISTSYGQVFLINCTDTTIKDIDCSNTSNGITIIYSTNCSVSNITCNDNSQSGIDVEDTDGFTAQNCSASGNRYEAIDIYGVSSAVVVDCVFNGNGGGVGVSSCPNANVSYNVIDVNPGSGGEGGDSAIELDYSPNCTVVGNTMTNSGVELYGSTKSDYASHTFTNNTVNGLPLGVIVNQTDEVISETYGQLILINSNSSTIDGLSFSKTSSGISLFYCNNTTLTNNNCSSNTDTGIYIRDSPYTTLQDNICNKNTWEGIYIRQSPYTVVLNNLCHSNGNTGEDEDEGTGIGISESPYTILFNNTITSNPAGIGAWEVTDITIANNTIGDNRYQGISLYAANANLVVNNTIYRNGPQNSGENYADAITLGNADDNIIHSNYLVRNWGFAVSLEYNSNNNTVYNNIIVDNAVSSSISQAFSEETDNHWNLTIQGNYWSDWNGSGAYPIDGYGFGPESFDFYPADVNILHTLTAPSTIYPVNGSTISGVVLFKWNPAVDSLWHNIEYELGFSTDGSSWFEITSGITDNEYLLNTSSLANGEYYFYVYPTCTEGFEVDPLFVFPVTINNVEHNLTIPSVSSPNGGETVTDTITIHWTGVTDSLSHGVTYAIFYSTDGISWTEIVTDLTTSSYGWDTNAVADGTTYVIKVVASCTEGLISEDVSDNEFTIMNEDESSTTPSSTPISTTESDLPSTSIGTSPNVGVFFVSLCLGLILIYRRKK